MVPSIVARSGSGQEDLATIYNFAATYPEACLHVVDLPWEMTSPDAQLDGAIGIWEDSTGQLVAFAHLWGGLVDFAIRPDAHTMQLDQVILQWAADRLAGSGTDQPPSLFAAAREDDQSRIAAYREHNFGLGSWSLIHMQRNLDDQLPDGPLPEGFVLRHLSGAEDVPGYVDAHRAAFDSTAMTIDWRLRTLQDPQYRPELDVVLTAPDGRIAAFCVCWMVQLRNRGLVGQVEPMGVRPEFRGLGLGRAVLYEGFRRLQMLGAKTVEIEHVDWNRAAQRLYASVGFTATYRVQSFVKDV